MPGKNDSSAHTSTSNKNILTGRASALSKGSTMLNSTMPLKSSLSGLSSESGKNAPGISVLSKSTLNTGSITSEKSASGISGGTSLNKNSNVLNGIAAKNGLSTGSLSSSKNTLSTGDSVLNNSVLNKRNSSLVKSTFGTGNSLGSKNTMGSASTLSSKGTAGVNNILTAKNNLNNTNSVIAKNALNDASRKSSLSRGTNVLLKTLSVTTDSPSASEGNKSAVIAKSDKVINKTANPSMNKPVVSASSKVTSTLSSKPSASALGKASDANSGSKPVSNTFGKAAVTADKSSASAAKTAATMSKHETAGNKPAVSANKPAVTAAKTAVSKSEEDKSNQKWNVGKNIDMIIIGASAGGADALIEVLPYLPSYLPPVLVVQHMEARFTALYANRLKALCQMPVRELKDGDLAEHGHIYIAPGGYHTTIHELNGKCFFKLDISPKVSGHRPSVNVIFDSAAKTLGNRALGVILTGMGDDGAAGLLKLRNTGAYTIGQDRATCLVYGMPKVAYEMGAVLKQLPLDKIATDIVFRCGLKPSINK